MSTFIERIETEHFELDEKIEKLETFIGGDIFKTLDPKMRALLSKQLEYMIKYSNILTKRLELLK